MVLSHIRDNFAAAFFPRLPEWGAAVMIFAMGWMLSVNADLMASNTGRAYAIMLAVADQTTWALVLALFGMARLLVLLINGAWRRSPLLRAVMALLSCLLWEQVAVSFAPTFGFAFILASGWLTMDMINVMRAMRDARTVDDAYRGARGGNK